MRVAHPLVITDTEDGRDLDWTHPADCPDGERCEILNRANTAPAGYMTGLADGIPPGAYLLGLFWGTGLCLLDGHGQMIQTERPAA